VYSNIKKLTFKEHITHSAVKCRKLILTLARSAKLNWGLSYNALKTLYTGGIQQLLLYGMISGVQRLINIKKAKAYRNVSNEALCIITGLKSIHIKIKKHRNSTKESKETDIITYKSTMTNSPNNGFTQQTGALPSTTTSHNKTQPT